MCMNTKSPKYKEYSGLCLLFASCKAQNFNSSVRSYAENSIVETMPTYISNRDCDNQGDFVITSQCFLCRSKISLNHLLNRNKITNSINELVCFWVKY